MAFKAYWQYRNTGSSRPTIRTLNRKKYNPKQLPLLKSQMLVAKGKKQENFPANRTCDKLTRTVIRCDTFRAPQGEAGLAAHPVFFVVILTE